MNVQSIGPSYLCRKKMILKIIRRINSRKILEVGCGSGDLALNLIRKYDYTGIDLNKYNTERLKLLGQSGKFYCSDIFKWKSKEKFDLILCFEVIEHIKDDKGFVKKLATFLKRGGTLILSTPEKMSWWGSNDVLAGHYRRYEYEQLFNLFKKLNMDNIKIYSLGFPITNVLKFYNDYRAKKILKKHRSENMEKFTEESGVKESNMLSELLFNGITMQPFYILQDIFAKTSFGINYLVIAKKK